MPRQYMYHSSPYIYLRIWSPLNSHGICVCIYVSILVCICMYTCVHVSICLVGANESWKVQSAKWGSQWKGWKEGVYILVILLGVSFDSMIYRSPCTLKMLEGRSILTIADPWPWDVRISICCSFKRTSYAIPTAGPLSGQRLLRFPVALTKAYVSYPISIMEEPFDNDEWNQWQGLGQILPPKMYM